MHDSHYKRFNVSRGFSYSYYTVPPAEGKPTLIFLHGFPSTSEDWLRQVAYFKPKGYGLIIPDMLGFGRSDKPLNVESYAGSLLAKDVVEIIEAESATDVAVIGHDWGSLVTSSLANRYQDRFTGFAFMTVGYNNPNGTLFDAELTRDATKEQLGYEINGYWWFFSSPESPAIIRDNIDAFYDVVWAKNPYPAWRYHIAPTGALQSFLESGKRLPRSKSQSKEEYRRSQERFLKSGYEAPTMAYRYLMSKLAGEDVKSAPEDQWVVQKPVLFLGAGQDAIAIPEFHQPTPDVMPNATSKILDSGHWIMFDAEKEVNKELEAWIKGL
ncbi:hypothetical protein CC1G_00645 [Coprinopsis cinerea okayama7|uniref:AB hydrolase-1 domain-containing protein n=1 Tax=Coprinopsis cinerea (strain Okayama-7 / 130 / ATCC MYA-4618 / FGSC 9003) TaxID=240176 RepID=A8N3E1_COPC7|nr:hypothetical protein CC1G_00645 [Coprinopsis cinerea okayama7\|eukprot:XP_001829466.2 hypothetical protein CC1G_00645 [Coprinopsis cinerea okayama7\